MTTTNPATWTTTEADLRALCLLATGTCRANALCALAEKSARLSGAAFRKLSAECVALVASTLEAAS